MPYSIIKYNNKEIFFIDHRGLKGEEVLKSMKEAAEAIKKNGKQVLTLTDFTDTTISNEINEYLKSDETKAMQKYYIKQGIVGIGGIKKMMFNIYSSIMGTNAKLFDNLEDAKKFLTT
jgi:CO dehydrogenase/acetyl-CoA synthase alpha subunit